MRRRRTNIVMLTCPYNDTHMVISTKFQNHLLKCEKIYPPLFICPYNGTHRMDKSAMEVHIQNCESRLAPMGNNLFPKVCGRVDNIDLPKVDNPTEEYWD